jgi:hypothetical protein
MWLSQNCLSDNRAPGPVIERQSRRSEIDVGLEMQMMIIERYYQWLYGSRPPGTHPNTTPDVVNSPNYMILH